MNLQFAILQFCNFWRISLQGYDYAARHIEDRQKKQSYSGVIAAVYRREYLLKY